MFDVCLFSLQIMGHLDFVFDIVGIQSWFVSICDQERIFLFFLFFGHFVASNFYFFDSDSCTLIVSGACNILMPLFLSAFVPWPGHRASI